MSTLQAGFGVSDITPPVGIELCGFGCYLERMSTGIVEPLLARAMVWQTGSLRGAIVACDLIGVSRELTAAVRAEVSCRTGIPPANVMLCATHTHSGPTTIPLIGWGEPDAAYMAGLPGRIAAAVEAASGHLAPATLSYGEAPVEGIAYNREYAGGATDPAVRVLQVNGARGPLGIVANYSCHPVVMCEATSLIGGDFVGMAMNAISARRGIVAMFLQGASGDQNSVYCHKPQEESLANLRDLAGRFAARIECALEAAAPIDSAPVAVSGRELGLPQVDPGRPMLVHVLKLAHEMLGVPGLPEPVRRRMRFEEVACEAVLRAYDRPDAGQRVTEVQGVRFGPVAILSQPAELFYELQAEFAQRTAPALTMLTGYTDDFVGYVPTPDRYDVSAGAYSYPAHYVPFMLGQWPFREDVGAVLVDALVELRQSLDAGTA